MEHTEITMTNAFILSHSYGDGLYEITLQCRAKDMDAIICEADHLNVKITHE